MMNKFFLMLLLSCSAFFAQAQVSKSNPYTMIQQVADITFKRFANEQSAIRQNPDLLKAIVTQELLPYIDYGYAAYKVIGQNFSKTTQEQRAEFVPVFRDYLVTSYAQVFTLYNQQKVTFEPARQLANQKIVAVNTIISEPGRNDINISFKVRLNSNTNEWKAFDMVAEGVSLLDSKQAELNSLIRQQGLPFVTNLLKDKADKHITFDSNKAS
jgi:phospholipid transport system substrate-binding protein